MMISGIEVDMTDTERPLIQQSVGVVYDVTRNYEGMIVCRECSKGDTGGPRGSMGSCRIPQSLISV